MARKPTTTASCLAPSGKGGLGARLLTPPGAQQPTSAPRLALVRPATATALHASSLRGAMRLRRDDAAGLGPRCGADGRGKPASPRGSLRVGNCHSATSWRGERGPGWRAPYLPG